MRTRRQTDTRAVLCLLCIHLSIALKCTHTSTLTLTEQSFPFFIIMDSCFFFFSTFRSLTLHPNTATILSFSEWPHVPSTETGTALIYAPIFIFVLNFISDSLVSDFEFR